MFAREVHEWFHRSSKGMRVVNVLLVQSCDAFNSGDAQGVMLQHQQLVAMAASCVDHSLSMVYQHNVSKKQTFFFTHCHIGV